MKTEIEKPEPPPEDGPVLDPALAGDYETEEEEPAVDNQAPPDWSEESNA
jgi:hypothetical protein